MAYLYSFLLRFLFPNPLADLPYLLFLLHQLVKLTDILIGKLIVMDSCDSAAGFYQLCGRTASSAKNGLTLIHNKDVVQRFLSCTGISHVFLVVNGVLLPVHIIGA